MTDRSTGFAKKRLALVLAGGLAGVVVGLVAVYGIGALTRNVGRRPGLPAGGRRWPRRWRRW